MTAVSIKKFKLMTEEELDRLKQKHLSDYNPELRTLAHLQDEIESVLMQNGVTTNEEKQSLLQTLQQRFNAIKGVGMMSEPTGLSKVIPNPAIAPNVPEPVAAPAAVQQAVSQGYDEDIANLRLAVPPKAYKKAEQLAKLISDHPDVISVDDQMQIVIRGRTLNGSNIVDLLNAHYAHRKRSDPLPHGFQAFAFALNDINVPQSLVTNKALIHSKHVTDVHKRTRSSYGYARHRLNLSEVENLPPGKSPNVLHVYN